MADQTIAEEYISSLQRRLELLEQRLIGEEKVRQGQPPLLHILKTIDRKLKALVEPVNAGDITLVWKKVPELEIILNPNYLQSLKLNDSAAQELLLCYTDQIHKYQQDIEDLNMLKETVNSSAFQGLETTEKDISSIASMHLQQEEEVTQLTNRVHHFIDSYTKFIFHLSSRCVQWDETLAQMETK